MQYLRSQYLSVSQEPGVYLFLDKNNNILYVGKAKNLKNRVSSYFTKNTSLGHKTKLLISRIEKIRIIIVGSEVESLLLEAAFIKKYSPPFNIRMVYGKSFPLIRITITNKYPAVLIARREDDSNSLYFGPYPNPSSMRFVLKTIRRIFPFQSVLNHSKKTCLYFHLGLCPCLPVFNSHEGRRDYKKNLKHVIQLLEGRTKKVIKELEKERKVSAQKEDFEKAGKIQEKINTLNLIVTPVHKPFEYEVNPNLRSDLRLNELNELKMVLKDAGIRNSSLKRIECFDVSNISGKMATGSMVVCIDGEKETSFYRRFKISQTENAPNDFAMMREVLQRRIKHFNDWGRPDLVIVDGGRGQVSVVMKIFKERDIKIPVIGLAKRRETIITADFKEINLPKDSPALHLIQRIRDEAHRFAITYHKKLRSKTLL